MQILSRIMWIEMCKYTVDFEYCSERPISKKPGSAEPNGSVDLTEGSAEPFGRTSAKNEPNLPNSLAKMGTKIY